MTNTFLDEKYEVPSKVGGYMKFDEEVNRFRILSKPILGWETWIDTPDGGRKPLRKRMNDPFSDSEAESPDTIKHFWAMVVWNYQDNVIQILEITQKSIQKALRALAKDEEWGSPFDYDIVVTKTGEKMETRYSTMPKPKKAIDAKIKKALEEKYINLDALYDGLDPFSKEAQNGEEKIKEGSVPL